MLKKEKKKKYSFPLITILTMNLPRITMLSTKQLKNEGQEKS